MKVGPQFIASLIDLSVKHGGDLTELQKFIEAVAKVHGVQLPENLDLWKEAELEEMLKEKPA